MKTDPPSAFAAALPQSPEAEAALLGCCLIDADSPDSTISKAQSAGITPADFFEPANGILYREIVRLQNESPPCTDGMLLHHLHTIEKLDAVGGMARILALTGPAPTTVHAKKYIAEVKDCAQRRHGITAAQRYIEQATQPDAKAAELVAALTADLDRIAGAITAKPGARSLMALTQRTTNAAPQTYSATASCDVGKAPCYPAPLASAKAPYSCRRWSCGHSASPSLASCRRDRLPAC
jgi:replicative DNA helicase